MSELCTPFFKFDSELLVAVNLAHAQVPIMEALEQSNSSRVTIVVRYANDKTLKKVLYCT